MRVLSNTNNLFSRIVLFAATVLLLLLVNQLASPKAHAAYEGGRLIDDGLFLDANSMSKNQIQNFLESKNSGLKDMKFKLQCYGSDSKEREWYTNAGATCDVNIPASHIIYYAAKIYGVNPKAILVTMQKEQSLITASNPTNWQLSQAMGYACPTSGSCSSSSNFSYQVDSGVWVLRYHFERARGNNTWWNNNTNWTCGTAKSLYTPNLYPGQNVKFYDTNGTHYRTHYLKNAATSSMYCYTPHAYNNPQGLYGLPKYGTKGLYYTGSYNFVKFFELWFGSTHFKLDFKPMHNPRYMRLMNNVTKTNLRTGLDDGVELSAGMEIYFSTRYTYEGELYVRTRIDTGKKLERGIRVADLEEITPVFEPMATPRWMEMNVQGRKVEPVTEAPLGGVIEPGTHFYFVDKVTIGDRLFLRTTYNASYDHLRVIPYDMLKWIALDYEPLSSPRWLELTEDIEKVHPTTNVPTGSVIPAGTTLFFDTKIRIDDELMLRTKDDTASDVNLTLPYSSTTSSVIDFKPMNKPRYMRLNTDTTKTNLRFGHDDGVLLSAGMEIYFSTRYIYEDELYVRTKVDTSNELERGIRYADLEEVD